MARPLIGVTAGYDPRSETAFFLRHAYVRSLERAGGLPVVLAPGRPEDAAELLDRTQGLLMSGGSDLDPLLYGRGRHERVTRVIRERDDFELALCREAIARDVPVLAICRGHQVLNVATGGTLLQDIPSLVQGAADHDPARERWQTAHDVRLLAGTRLRQILGRERVAVNSFHHQAVETPGAGLVVSALAVDDGVVEGIEAPARRFVIGVQWHPEEFWRDAEGFHPLFAAFVDEAARA